MAFLSKTTTIGASPITASVPLGVLDNMGMLAICMFPDNGGSAWSTPTGWTLIANWRDTRGEDQTFGVYSRVASSEPASYDFTHDSTTGGGTVVILAYDGDYSGGLFDVTFVLGTHKATQYNSNNPTIPDITTQTNAAYVLAVSGITHNDITVAGAPTGYTLREGLIGSSYNHRQLLIAEKVVPVAGVESPGAWTNTDNGSAFAESTSFVLAIKPSSADPSLDDVDTDETTTDGQTGATFTYSDFSGDPTSLILTDNTNDTANLLVSASGGSGTFDLPDVSGFTVDTPGVPFSSANHSLLAEITYLAEVASLEITHNPRAGFARIDVVSAVTGEGSIFETVFTDNSQIYYSTANNTAINADGVYSTDSNSIEGAVWNIDTGIWEPFTVTIGGGEPPASSDQKGVVRTTVRSAVRSIVRSI